MSATKINCNGTVNSGADDVSISLPNIDLSSDDDNGNGAIYIMVELDSSSATTAELSDSDTYYDSMITLESEVVSSTNVSTQWDSVYLIVGTAVQVKANVSLSLYSCTDLCKYYVCISMYVLHIRRAVIV